MQSSCNFVQRARHARFNSFAAVFAFIVTVMLGTARSQLTCPTGSVLQATGPSTFACAACVSGYYCQNSSFNVYGAVDSSVTANALSPLPPGSQYVAIDPSGVYALVTDYDMNIIRRIVFATGAVSIVAGSGASMYQDGIGTVASFFHPAGVSIDPSGTYALIADSWNNRIRRLFVSTGAVFTLAGSGGPMFADGAGTLATFSDIKGVCIDPSGTYALVADTSVHRIRSVVISTGFVSTLAGSGSSGSTNAVGAQASFNKPYGVSIDPSGTFALVTEYGNHCIRRVEIATGSVSTLAGSMSYGSVDGVGSLASFLYLYGVSIDPSGTYALIAEGDGSSQSPSIRRVVIASGVVSTILVSKGFSKLSDVAIDPSGSFAIGTSSDIVRLSLFSRCPSGYFCTPLLQPCNNGYFCDFAAFSLSAADKYGTIDGKVSVSTISGSGINSNQDGIGIQASYSVPRGVSIDPSGLYALIADAGSNSIRRLVIATGNVTTVAGSGSANSTDGVGLSASFLGPVGLSIDPSGTYALIADAGNNRIRRLVIATGEVSTVAGSDSSSPFADGIGTRATFHYPSGISIDPSGLFALIADKSNSRIRRLMISSGNVSIFAGSGVGGFTCVDGIGTSATFSGPYGVSIEPSGKFALVADSGHNRIRRIEISTVNVISLAGSITGSADGVGTSALFDFPYAVSVDPSGMYALVVELNSNRVRRIVISTGAVSTVAGSGFSSFADGTGTLASFGRCQGVSSHPSGEFAIVADSSNNRIRRIELNSPCPSGSYCIGGQPSKYCDPGAYCPSGSSTPAPFQCPVGMYCMNGPPQPCLSGYYCPSGSSSATQITCPAGYYCTTNLTSPAQCSAGYYCTPGSSVPRQLMCKSGSYCPAGSSSTDVPCPAGFSCDAGIDKVSCAPGYICGPGTPVNPAVICPIGSYCPSGTSTATVCPAGSYCANPGQSNVSGVCPTFAQCPTGSMYPTGLAMSTCSSAGFYCNSGSSVVTGCMPGRFCSVGSGTPSVCQPGSLCSTSMLSAPIPCTAGSYCATTGLTVPTSLCPVGSMCPAGSSTSQNCTRGLLCASPGMSAGTACPFGQYCLSMMGIACGVGTYSLGNSAVCSLCTAGSYSNSPGASSCIPCSSGAYCPAGSSSNDVPCPAGYSCDAGSDKVPCSSGYICMVGTPSNPKQICPAGTYCPAGSSSSTVCPAGSYCATAGLSFPTNTCPTFAQCPPGSAFITGLNSLTCSSAGFYCASGSSVVTGCMPGSYCPGGSVASILCPPGFICNSSMMSSPVACSAGSYCALSGMTVPSALCPTGSMCPPGSLSPQNCTRGLLCASPGMSAGTACPFGQYCMSMMNVACSVGTYSLGNSAVCTSCPAGTFSSSAGSSSCQLCALGSYPASVASLTCTKCGTSNTECLLGARNPTPVLSTAVKSFSPITSTNSANQQQMISVGMMVAFVFAPLVLGIVALGVAADKFSSLSSLTSRCRDFGWSRFDFLFSAVHNVPDGQALVIRKTSFGATMTVATLVAFVGAGTVLGYNTVQFPNYVASVSPQPAPWQPSGVFELSVTVYGGGLDSCTAGPANGFGIFAQSADWSVSPTRVPNQFNPVDGSCRLTWRCEGRCSMLALESTTLQLRSPTRSWASALSFSITTPLFVKETSIDNTLGSVPFQLSSSFYASPSSDVVLNDTSFAIRGSAATQVQISLSPHVLMDSNGNYSSVAFEPSLVGITFGDVTSLGTFNFASNDGFAVSFVLTRSSLSLVLTAPSAILTFLVLISSMAGSIITAFAVLFKQLEKFFDIGSQSSSGSDTDSLAPTSKQIDKSQVNIELTDWQPDSAITQQNSAVAKVEHVASVPDERIMKLELTMSRSVNDLRDSMSQAREASQLETNALRIETKDALKLVRQDTNRKFEDNTRKLQQIEDMLRVLMQRMPEVPLPAPVEHPSELTQNELFHAAEQHDQMDGELLDGVVSSSNAEF